MKYYINMCMHILASLYTHTYVCTYIQFTHIYHEILLTIKCSYLCTNVTTHTHLRRNIELLPPEHSIVEGHCSVVIHQLMYSQTNKFCSPKCYMCTQEYTYIAKYVYMYNVYCTHTYIYVQSTL